MAESRTTLMPGFVWHEIKVLYVAVELYLRFPGNECPENRGERTNHGEVKGTLK